jgi:signal transduction histidine kinase
MSRFVSSSQKHASDRQSSVVSPTAGQGKVLIVEDEPEILEPLAHSLRRAGFSVLCAEDGLTACRIIGSERPDLVLLDIMLPDLDGWEVCRLLRQHPEAQVASIPVVMLTALGATENKYRGLEIGADLFLSKPYSIREVILVAGNLVKRRQQAVALETRLEHLTRKERQNQNLHHLLFHELRNQLMILNGYSELLNKDPEGKQAGTCRDAIYRSSNYLQTLAEEVLLIRQVEDGQLVLPQERFMVEDLFTEIVQVYDAPAREKCTQLQFRSERRKDPLYLSRPALKIILSALVDNSLKYGPAGQTVQLTCRERDERIEIVVSDQGPAIPEDQQERIFEPFVRSNNGPDHAAGSGLGLHAVRVLTVAMGGDVNVESLAGQGNRFRICLPLQANAADRQGEH